MVVGCIAAFLICVTRSEQASAQECVVGVNVNSFQNFTAAQQDVVVQQLVSSGVRCVRTSLRPDDKDIRLIKELQQHGIGLVLVPGFSYAPDVAPRPAGLQRHMRSAMPLSAADPDLSRVAYQEIFGKMDSNGIGLTGIELGNEINWTDFNGDFPVPGEGRAFDLQDLSTDPEAEQAAWGLLQYLKVLAVLKDVRDHSRLNQHTPIIAAGMAEVSDSAWLHKLGVDGVSIPATYPFLRAHGLDDLVDGYGVHCYPKVIKPGNSAGAAQQTRLLDTDVFPSGNTKPYWVTEWGISSDARESSQDQARTEAVAQMRAYFQQLAAQGRLGGIFWYVWNEPDHDSIYRGGTLMDAGKLAIAPLPGS